MLRSVLSILGIAGLCFLMPAALVFLLYSIRKKQQHPNLCKTAACVLAAAVILTAGSYIGFFIASVKLYSSLDTDRLPVISVTSDNLHDGVWDAVISNTSQGENRSPQLSWSPVSGAAGYAVCMVDESAGDWLHWKQTGITTPGLAQGAASASQYIGPYPPAGTHTYTVYVFALQDTDTDFRGSLDSNSMDFYAIVQKLDLTEGDKTGNVLACGKLSGQFSHVEEMQ